MYYKIHPPVLDPLEQNLEKNQILAHLAQLDTLLLEFEHSEEFRDCSANYLSSPKIILEDFIHETQLPIEYFDSEALEHSLFAVIPSRITGLLPEDAHQIFREQISFWAFVSAQWQLQYAPECIHALQAPTLNKLHEIISLGETRQKKKGKVSRALSHGVLSAPFHQESWCPQEQDVYSLTQLTEI